MKWTVKGQCSSYRLYQRSQLCFSLVEAKDWMFFVCWLVVWVLWLLTLTGTRVSVPTGQVSSVCTDTVAVCLRLLCIAEEFAVETTETAVCLWSFVGCSERAAFLASGNEMPRSTLSCCTRFSSFHFGQSRDEVECSPLQLAHFWWLLQFTPSWPACPHFVHIAALLQAFELWPYFWHLKQRRGLGMYGSTGTLR